MKRGMLLCVALFSATVYATPQTDAYLSHALDLIKQHAYYAGKLDWKRVRSDAKDPANSFSTPSDTYDFIKSVLVQLGDHHSFFIRSMPTYENARGQEAPAGWALGSHLGYLRLPQHTGKGRLDDGRDYATVARQLIGGLDARGVCGWVLDLRWNEGGNMYPMLAGIGPLLGDGPLGAFVDRNGKKIVWGMKDGAVLNSGKVAFQKPAHPVKATPQAPVAVLISGTTASSGEAVAISLEGRPHTRFFGQPTYGLTSANQPFPLPDQAALVLTVALEQDRKGRLYTQPVQPDQVTEPVSDPPIQGQVDATMTEASAWLKSQAPCTGGRQAVAPSAERKPPRTLRFTQTILMSRSARLLSKGT